MCTHAQSSVIAARIAFVIAASVLAGCGDEFPSEPAFDVSIEQASPWPEAIDAGQSVMLGVNVVNAQLGSLLPSRATWETSDPDVIRIEFLPANSGNARADTLAARRALVRAVAVGSGTATVTATIAAGSGMSGATHSFDITVKLWKQVVGFTGHTCGLTGRGFAYCWGAPIGSEEETHLPTPRLVSVPFAEGGLRFATLVAGQTHVCGQSLVAMNVWFCWGQNGFGQLTNGNRVNSVFPELMNHGMTLSNLAVADEVSCGIGPQSFFFGPQENDVYCWGEPIDAAGPLRFDYSVPTPFSPVEPDDRFGSWGCSFESCPGYYELAVGVRHACGLFLGIDLSNVRRESVVCWGDNSRGQLAYSPQFVPGRNTADLAAYGTATGSSHTVTNIVATRFATCVLANGIVHCWGDGFGHNPTPVLANVAMASLTGSRDGDTVCGVGAADGLAYCVSSTTGLQVATPSTAADGTPLRFASLMTAGRVIGGTDLRHTCGVTTPFGAIYCWGYNHVGQLGRDTQRVPATLPVKVLEPL
jgi:hypothetical protein